MSALKNRFHHSSRLATWDIANNSASVVKVVTVDCFVDPQSMVPPSRFQWCPHVLLLDVESSVKEASLDT